MIKAEQIAAVRLTLSDGTKAVFVQEGIEWNTLTELRCVAPAELRGEVLITAPDTKEGGRMTSLFDNIFGRVVERSVVMASPRLAAALRKSAPSESTSGGQP